MKKFFAGLIIAFLFVPSPAQGQGRRPEVAPPERILFNNKTFLRNAAWADKEITLTANLDEDADSEIVIGFMGTYTPPVKTAEEPARGPFDAPKPQEIPIQENQAFYQIYDKDPGGHYRCVKTITGMDQIGRAVSATLDPDKPKALLIISPGGENYTQVSVYRWQEGGYRLLFNDGAPGTVEILTDRQAFSFNLGRTVYAWNSSRQKFETSLSLKGEK